MAEFKPPSWMETCVGLALLHEEDGAPAVELLEGAGVHFQTLFWHGMVWIDVAAGDYELALRNLQNAPGSADRFVQRRKKSRDESIRELIQIPRRSTP